MGIRGLAQSSVVFGERLDGYFGVDKGGFGIFHDDDGVDGGRDLGMELGRRGFDHLD